MSNQVGLRARKRKLYAKNIAITYKTSSFKAYSHGITLSRSINSTMDIYENVVKLLNDINNNESFRSIGVRLSSLNEKNIEQVSLFETVKEDSKIQEVIDDINLKYHSSIVMPAIFFKKEK